MNLKVTQQQTSPVLSCWASAKHLVAHRDRPFAEFTLSEANVLRVTQCDCSNYQQLFFIIEPNLTEFALVLVHRLLLAHFIAKPKDLEKIVK